MAAWLRNYRGGIVVFLISLGVYLFTLSRTIFLNDSAEFVTAGATLGIPHPPGFPLYVLLAKVFSWLPISTIAFRINLLSAVASAAALVLLYGVAKRILEKIFPGLTRLRIELLGIACALTLAFSPTFWSQAVVAESYALNLFFTLLLLFLSLRYLESKETKWIWWVGLVAGLGAANHPMLVLFSPVFLLAIVLPKPRPEKAILGASLFSIVLAAALYALLPLRSAMIPLLDWGHTSESLRHFFAHLTRAQYTDVGFGAGLKDKGQYLAAFFYDWLSDFGILLVLVLAGFTTLIKKFFSKILDEQASATKLWVFNFFWITSAIFIINTLGIILLRDSEFNFDNRYYYSTYYTPAYAISALLLIVGFSALFSWLQKRFANSRRTLSLFLLLILAIPAFLFVTNFKTRNLRNFSFIEDFSYNLLKSLEPNAVLVLSTEGTASDPLTFSLLYQTVVRKLRPDITIVGYVDIFPTSDRKTINNIYRIKDLALERNELIKYTVGREDFSARPIYTTFIVDNLPLEKDYYSLSNGFVYKLVTNQSEEFKDNALLVEPSAHDEEVLRGDYAGLDFLGYYYLVSAAQQVVTGNREKSQLLYIKAINADRDITGLDIEAYRVLRERELHGN